MRTFDDSQTEALLSETILDGSTETLLGGPRPSVEAGLVITIAILSEDSLVEAALRARLRAGVEPGPLLSVIDDPRRAAVLVWDARAVEHDEGGLPLLPVVAREPAPRTGGTGGTPPPVVALLPDGDFDPLPLLAAGVRGLVARDASPGRLRAAVEAVHRGLTVLDEDPGDTLVAMWSPESGTLSGPRPANEHPRVEQLTRREQEVLALMADGLSNRAIGDALGISAHTVKFHVDGLLDKLGARSRTHAVVEAVRRGLLELV